MASLFISYSRRDIETARKLTDSFKAQNLDFWIDWEGIPPTVDWWKEIEQGIEEADVFLFLLSPDSAGSKACKQEIEYAAKNGKRLIPLVVRDIKADESPVELRSLNWIFLRESDDFNVGFSKLITAIKTDYEWVQAHRQLLVKALEWQKNNKENGFLLHGEELQDAEIQLATNTAKEPRPTDLQREYVLKSRQITDRTRNRTIGGLAGFSILILGLLIFSLIQLNSSRAQQLALQAQVAFAEQRYADAGLYAYQSSQIHSNDEAEKVLGKLAFVNFATGRPLTGHKDAITSVAWSGDGRLASASNDDTIIIWDLSAGKPAQIIPVANPRDLSWSGDGRLASAGDDGITIWNLSTGKPAQVLGESTFIRGLAWSTDGRLASTSDEGITLWDVSIGRPTQILRNGEDRFGSIAWSGDGRLASIGHSSSSNSDEIIIWDLFAGKPAQILKAGSMLDSIAWSSDGRLASAEWDSIIIWDLSAGKPGQFLQRKSKSLSNASYFESVAWSADGRLASASDDGTVIIWNLYTGEPAQTFQGYTSACRLAAYPCVTVYGVNVAWSADGHLASTSEDGTITIWSLISDRPAQTLNRFQEAVYIASSMLNKVYIASWSTDGRLASGSEDSVILWDLSTGEPAQILQGHKDPVNSVAWSANGRLASSSDHQIIIWDLSTGKPAQALTENLESVSNLAWSPDGRLAFSNFRFIEIWDPSNGKHTRIHDKHRDTPVDDVTWLPDGRLASTSKGRTIIWDLKTNQFTEIWTGTSQLEGRNVEAWSSDGRLASAAWVNDVVTIWDVSTGKPAFTLRGRKAIITSLAWSSDGRLASGSDDGAIIIWDISTGKPIRVLRPFESAVVSLFWSADGRLTAGSLDGFLKIARSDLLEETPCDWIYRNMTIQEWLDYQGPLYVYRPACPNLPVPPTDIRSNPNWILDPQLRRAFFITWKGRITVLVIAVVFLAVLAGVLWWSFQFIFWSFRKIYEKLRKKPDTT